MLGKHEDRPDSNFCVFNTFDEIRPETQEQVTDSQEGASCCVGLMLFAVPLPFKFCFILGGADLKSLMYGFPTKRNDKK